MTDVCVTYIIHYAYLSLVVHCRSFHVALNLIFIVKTHKFGTLRARTCSNRVPALVAQKRQEEERDREREEGSSEAAAPTETRFVEINLISG